MMHLGEHAYFGWNKKTFKHGEGMKEDFSSGFKVAQNICVKKTKLFEGVW